MAIPIAIPPGCPMASSAAVHLSMSRCTWAAISSPNPARLYWGDLVVRGTYVTLAQAEMIAASLSNRDRAILHDLARVRVLTGEQLTRLHFSELAPESRERTRRRVLARLAAQQLVATLERTVGGARAGSSGLIFSLGIAAQRVLALLDSDGYISGPPSRVRAPVTPGRLFLAHTLAVSSMYVALRERERAGELTVTEFATESAAWWPDGRGGVIKPDAYVQLRAGTVVDSYWAEVDRATESLPTLKRKLIVYADFARTGQLGPDDVVPRVLLTVPHDRRLADVRDLVAGLQAPGPELILPTLHGSAAGAMIDILRG